MRRREFITLIGGAAAAWPITARAQQGERVRRIGMLYSGLEADPLEQRRAQEFKRLLSELGWTQGRSIQIDPRFAGGDPARMRVLAAEMVATQPEIIIGAGSTALVTALIRETRSIPIVFANVSDPLGSGMVANLARPGGNVTGFSNFEFSMGSKWLEFLKKLVPAVKQAGIMFNPETVPGRGTFFLRAIEAGAPSLKVDSIATPVLDTAQIEAAMSSLAREPDNGLIVMPDIFAHVHRELIVRTAARQRLPAVYPYRYFAEIGGLLSYGVDSLDIYRKPASYVDRILRGEKPADLPVQAPTKFEFVINLRTAKAIGLDVPLDLLARADEVIE